MSNQGGPKHSMYGIYILRRSMYGIYAYIGVVWGFNIGIYRIHGVSGIHWGGCRGPSGAAKKMAVPWSVWE